MVAGLSLLLVPSSTHLDLVLAITDKNSGVIDEGTSPFFVGD